MSGDVGIIWAYLSINVPLSKLKNRTIVILEENIIRLIVLLIY